MNLIIDFYKELDTLNLIIFWGIIIVIILLLIFSFILINKNKKLKKIVEEKNIQESEIPIKKNEEIQEFENIIIKDTEIKEKEQDNYNEIITTIETENDFVVEEHIANYQNVEKSKDTLQQENKKRNSIEIPNKPYQRNVLREMSLSQTSPIGINGYNIKEDKKTEMIQDLEETLSIEEEVIENNIEKKQSNNIINEKQINEITSTDTNNLTITNIKEILDIKPDKYSREVNTNKDNYLEEVSRKLAESDIEDDIERTNYELQQEEDAIISYKELMEKKDSIQTIDEEDAIISIEELMTRANQQQEEIKNYESKQYRLTEEENNDNFIQELKKFRKDL